ncbi:MAG: WG repeat-containing protein [Cyclobacteriaceae bacterium]
MKVKNVIVFLLILTTSWGLLAGNLGRIRKLIEKGDFEKAEKTIRKSQEKEPDHPGTNYYLSYLFIEEAYSIYDIDSALHYWQIAKGFLDSASQEISEELLEESLTEEDFGVLYDRISAAAFSRTYRELSVDALETFLGVYDMSNEAVRAVELRDSLAYEASKQTNTWQGYQSYFQTYPDSEYASQAQQKYERLLYQSYTIDGNADGYIRYLRDYPDAPFRTQAIDAIYEMVTAKDQMAAYKWFLNEYPDAIQKKKAADILYFKALSLGGESLDWIIDNHADADSLQRVHRLRGTQLIPTLEKGKFGFMTLNGEALLAPSYTSISNEYLCGKVTADWLEVGSNGIPSIINRNGDVIIENYVSVKELSPPIYLVETDAKKLYHGSGFLLSQRKIDDAKCLSNGWIAFKTKYNWGLMLPNGKELLVPKYSSIDGYGSFLVLEQDGLYALASHDEILNKTHNLKFIYDDFEVASDSLLFVYNEDQEGLFDLELNTIQPLSNGRIYSEGGFIYVAYDDGIQVVRDDGITIEEGQIDDLTINEGWLGLESDSTWRIVSRMWPDSIQRLDLDSIRLFGPRSAYIQSEGESKLLFDNGKEYPLSGTDEYRYITSSESKYEAAYWLLRKRSQLQVLGMDGEALFEGTYSNVTAFSDSTFRVKVANSMGFVDRKGKEILKTRYDLLDENDAMVFLLRDGKIGAVDLRYDAIISSKFDARIERIDSGKYQVKTSGKLGVIDPKENFLIPAQYDEIQYWNDTAIWVKEQEVWSLMTFDQELVLTGIKSLKPWLKNSTQEIWMAFGEDGYGLYGTEQGEILPLQYNEIINVGTDEQPVFFAEQHLKTASLFVVTYFNLEGETIRSQAYRPDEYDLIYCEE